MQSVDALAFALELIEKERERAERLRGWAGGEHMRAARLDRCENAATTLAALRELIADNERATGDN